MKWFLFSRADFYDFSLLIFDLAFAGFLYFLLCFYALFNHNQSIWSDFLCSHFPFMIPSRRGPFSLSFMIDQLILIFGDHFIRSLILWFVGTDLVSELEDLDDGIVRPIEIHQKSLSPNPWEADDDLQFVSNACKCYVSKSRRNWRLSSLMNWFRSSEISVISYPHFLLRDDHRTRQERRNKLIIFSDASISLI